MRPDGSHFLVLGESGDTVSFPVTEERFSAALQSGDLDGICRAYEKGCEARRRAYNTDKWRHRKIPPEAVATVTQLFTPESLADYIAANACRTQTNIADSPFVLAKVPRLASMYCCDVKYGSLNVIPSISLIVMGDIPLSLRRISLSLSGYCLYRVYGVKRVYSQAENC